MGDDVAPTITARFDELPVGNLATRSRIVVSRREGALLQSFPMDFVFTGNKVDIARQIGNAVPPLLAEKIGQSIIECYRKVGEK
ncbi:MAG: DNA cytosine methyltransferase [Hydrogeniiclostridium mannosilyticum]